MIVYCTETLTNNGIISMTARGAYAKGQNVYLFKERDESFKYVSAVGGSGGSGRIMTGSSDGSMLKGNGYGALEVSVISCAGGGGGAANTYSRHAYAGNGGSGTSYSGGCGGGCAGGARSNGDITAESGSSVGGKGGAPGNVRKF